MAKPMLTTVPFLLLLVDLWPLRRFTGAPPARLLLEKLPFLVLAVAAGVLTMVAGQHIDARAPFQDVAIGVRLAKMVVDSGFDMELSEACTLEAFAFGVGFASEDQKEGMTAFVEKRKPNFKGR